MKALTALTITLLISTSAFATGGFYCATEDSNVALEISATVPRGFGVQLIEPTVINLLNKTAGLPNEMKSLRFEVKEIPQYWNDGSELKILAHKEIFELDFYNETQVLVKTTYNENTGEYQGTFSVKTIANVNNQSIQSESIGNITCSVE